MVQPPEPLAAAEAKYETDGGARGMRSAVGETQADVIELRTNGNVARHSEVHAAASAPGEPMRAAAPRCKAICSHQSLDKRRDALSAICGEARAAQKCIGIGGNAGLRKVIDTEISNNAKPIVEVAGAGNASAVRVGSAREAFAKIGVANREIAARSFLCACCQGQRESDQNQESKSFHLRLTPKKFRCNSPGKCRLSSGENDVQATRNAIGENAAHVAQCRRLAVGRD